MPNRTLILNHLLPIVPFDGWSDYALREAGKQAGVDPKQAFPGGIEDCIDYYFAQGDEELKRRFHPPVSPRQRGEEVIAPPAPSSTLPSPTPSSTLPPLAGGYRGVDKKIDLTPLRIPARIEKLLNAKLGYFLPHRDAVRRAASHRAMPWNTRRATQSLYRSVDLMWRIAGDTSLDFSFYTKRATLAGLYTGTLLYWLNDDSENQSDTAAFIKRRLAEIGAFGKWKKETSERLHSAIKRPA